MGGGVTKRSLFLSDLLETFYPNLSLTFTSPSLVFVSLNNFPTKSSLLQFQILFLYFHFLFKPHRSFFYSFFPLVFLLHLCLTVVFTSSLWLWIFLASIFPHYFSCVFPYFLTFANFRIFPHTTFIPIYCIQFSFRLRYYFINRLYLPLVFFPFIFFFIYLILPLPRLMIITISIWIQFFLLTFFSFRSLRLVFVFPKNQFCLYFISGV